MNRHYIYYIIGVALAALSACTGDPEPTAEGTVVPIGFTASVSEAGIAQTRAGSSFVEGTAFGDGATVGVFASSSSGLLARGNSGYEASTANNLSNAPLSVSGNTLNYATERYWPTDEVTFFGYYPRVDLSDQGAPGNPWITYDNQAPPSTITYTMPASAAEQVDLLVSEVTKTTLSQTGRGITPLNGVVPLVFHHALSQIRFYVLIDADEDGIWWDADNNKAIDFVVRIDLSGVYASGTLTIGSDASSNEWGGHSWGGQNGSATSYADNATWTAVNAKTFNQASFRPDDYGITDAEKMLVIPATYTTLPTMTVSVRDDRSIDDSQKNGTASLSTSLTANDGASLTWKAGYIYNYFFVIELGKTVKGYFLDPKKKAEQW